MVRRSRILNLAIDILNKSKVVKAPVPIETIAKKYGLQVRLQPLESNLSGFLYRDGKNSLIGVNSHNARVRQRFTIAHELGHFLLHQGDSLHVDRAVFAKLRSDLSSQGVDEEEIEANLFAAELLMPRELIARDLENADIVDILEEEFLLGMSKNYDVSLQALVLRLNNLGYIDQHYSYQGVRRG